jgi:hypothetical protein
LNFEKLLNNPQSITILEVEGQSEKPYSVQENSPTPEKVNANISLLSLLPSALGIARTRGKEELVNNNEGEKK